ncbi:MAG TPA: TIR domain-containing protein [Thermoanaerobaculia bacterium]|nr:TIR domain-containing protein [Thermoanaerobaculia bacterium]
MEKPRYDVFLSHATADKPVVEELARLLKKAGFEPWLDKWNLIPGEPWQEAIEKALEECATCAVFLGPSGTGPWQNEEMRAAIDRRVADRSRTFRVIPVLLPRSERGEPSRLPAFLRATTWVEFRDTLDDDKALHRLVSGIRGLPPGADPGEAVAEGAQPYRGLQVFDVGDALFFFGREALREWLLDKLRADRSGNRFLAIVGPSGSGKSSLARAGLVAALKRGEIPGSDAWPAAICKPGAQPLESLAVALADASGLGNSPSAVRDLIRDLDADPRMLHLTTRLALRDAPADRRLVLLVDQFEETFTLCPDEEQRKAIIANLLHAATAADGQTVVVLTLRADFYGRCAAYPDLATAVSDRQSLVGPMTRDEFRSAIERPAYLAGCELEGGLTDLLLNEVESQPGSLPLLEHALFQIWQRREGGRRLTVAAYRQIGGVAGALEKHAEEIYSGFTEEEKETCRRIFLRLVQIDEQGRATKRRLELEELPGEDVVSRLTNARLLTTAREKRATVEIAHEALLGNWKRLKGWVEQDREGLRARQRLDEAVAEWIGRERAPSFLLKGGRLAQAEEWAAGRSGEMGQEAQDFLAASTAAKDQERWRQKAMTLTFGVIAAVAILAAFAALYSRHIAEKQRRIAVAIGLSERSRTAFGTNPQLGLLLAAEALKMARSAGEAFLPNAHSAMHWALSKSGGIPLPSGGVVDVLLTHDRTALFTYGVDGHLRRWDLRNDTIPKVSEDFGEMDSDAFPQLAAPSSGQWLLLDGRQGARLFNLKIRGAGAARATLLRKERWWRNNEPFSPDGRWLATIQGERLVIRDLEIHGAPTALQAQMGKNVTSIVFSSDSKMLAAASREGLIEVWNLRSKTPTTRWHLPEKLIPHRLAFQTDGTLIVTASVPEDLTNTSFWAIRRDNTVLGPNILVGCIADRGTISGLPETSVLCMSSDTHATGIWRTIAGTDSKREIELPGVTSSIAASPEGAWISLGDTSGDLYLENKLEEKALLKPFSRQAGLAQGLYFPKGGRWLVTFSFSEAPRFWDLQQGQAIADFEPRVFRMYEPIIPVLTAKGEYLRWDRRLGEFRFSALSGAFTTKGLEGMENRLFPYAASADGRWFAGVAGYPERTLKIWKVEPDGSVNPPISISGETFTSIAFSSRGNWLAASSTDDGSGLLWNLRNLKEAPFHLTNSNAPMFSVVFSPGEEMVATSSEQVRIRDLDRSGPQRADSPDAPSYPPFPGILAFSNDGKWLAMEGHGDKIQIWEPHGPIVNLENRGGRLESLVFSADGHWLAAGSPDGTLQLWRWNGVKTNPTPIILPGHSKGIRSLIFTPDGLLSMSADRTVRQWELRTDKLLELACRNVGRTLTAQEWNLYLGSEPYQPDEPCPGLPRDSN